MDTTDGSTIGYLIDDGAKLYMGCNNPYCLANVEMDLTKMAARFGQSQSCLHCDLVKIYPFRCKLCGSWDWQLTHIPGSCIRLGEEMKMRQHAFLNHPSKGRSKSD